MQLKDIKPNEDNPRTISKEKMEKLKRSISEFPRMMELRPMVVDSDMVILGGNKRYLALKELRYTEIPDAWVKKADDLTPDEYRRFIIEDNVPFGEWDFDALNNDWDLGELDEWGLDIPNDLLQPDVAKGLIDDNEIPEVKAIITQPGDLWTLGKHRLLCGDSTKSEDVKRLMGGGRNKSRHVIHRSTVFN